MSENAAPQGDRPDAGVPPSPGMPVTTSAPPVAGRQPGWREVLVVAAVVVGIVLGLAILTSVLPAGLQEIVFRTPLAIVVLVVGTVGLLLALALRRPDGG